MISVLGAKLDAPGQWRPTLQCVRRPDLLAVDRLIVLEQDKTSEYAVALVRDLKKLAPSVQVERVPIPLENPWDFEEVYERFYEFCRAQTWDDRCEYYVHLTTGTHVMQIVWYLLVSERFAPARLVQTRPGKRDGPPGPLDIVDLDLSRYPAIARRRHTQQLEGQSLLKMGIETRSEVFAGLIASLERAALGPPVPLLLWGETGVGKSALARRIYALRKARGALDGPLVEVNCATLRGALRESALFGHKRGAFTGAERDRKGYLLAADEGMLFLDEVGELGLEEQAVLLTAIEEGRFFPVGADTPVHSRFALVCGTNRDLRVEVQAGRFRDDLLARISTWSFCLPPLRERREDIEENLRFELERFADTYKRQVRFSRAGLKTYLAFARSEQARWPHNFRDLSQSVLRMCASASEGLIDTDDVASEITRLSELWAPATGGGLAPSYAAQQGAENAPASLHRVERVQHALVLEALRRSRSLAEAGRWLFDGDSAQGAKTNHSDRARKLCARMKIDPLAYLQS